MAKDAKIQCIRKNFKTYNCRYQNIKTCIRKGNEYSELFNCEIGVKQGENLSPYLFSLYLNDLEFFLAEIT